MAFLFKFKKIVRPADKTVDFFPMQKKPETAAKYYKYLTTNLFKIRN